MNEYRIIVEEVIVHGATAKAATPEAAFEQVRDRHEAGEFDTVGECQETRVAVLSPSGDTLIDFEKL